VANDTDDDLLCFAVCKVKHPIVTNPDAVAVAVFEFLAAMRKRVAFE
jgi:hypothetical protein